VSLRLASGADRQAWSKISPGTLKQRLLARRLPSTRDLDVWSLGPLPSGQPYTRHLSPGDLVVLPRQDVLDARDLSTRDNGPDQVVVVAPQRGNHIVKVAAVDGQAVDLRLVIASRPHGLHLPEAGVHWPADGEVTA
jgi:hypothetical protein